MQNQITVDKLLKMEDEYSQAYKNDIEPLFDVVDYEEPFNYCDGLDFLRKRTIHSYYEFPKNNELIREFNFNDMEFLVLNMFIGRDSKVFRLDSYPFSVPKIVVLLSDILNNALKKLPTYNGGELYRHCNDFDLHSFGEGECFSPNYQLTTTTDREWKPVDCIYKITPLDEKRTFGRCVYKYNPNGENQVSFLKGAKFLIQKIYPQNAKKCKMICMKEI